VPFKPKDRSDVRRIANNLYVKNYPDSWTDEKLKEMFSAYGTISNIHQIAHDNGKFAFVCFLSADPNDHEYGPQCAYKAMQELHGKDFEDKKLYVAPALNSAKRAEQKLRETIKYKNSKKRCNLYVKNIDPNSTEEGITEIFKCFGDIESVKLFPTDNSPKAYAFVCYKTPDQA
jgi:polyadenylate-binding protein